MPALTRWLVKTSFIYLLLAIGVGVLLALQSTVQWTVIGGLFPVYIHLFVLGWLTELIFGVVYWMFPKYSNERPRAVMRLAGGHMHCSTSACFYAYFLSLFSRPSRTS